MDLCAHILWMSTIIAEEGVAQLKLSKAVAQPTGFKKSLLCFTSTAWGTLLLLLLPVQL